MPSCDIIQNSYNEIISQRSPHSMNINNYPSGMCARLSFEIKIVTKIAVTSSTSSSMVGLVSLSQSVICPTSVAPTFVTSTTFVTAHQFCQFISTAFVDLTTFVNSELFINLVLVKKYYQPMFFT